MGVYFKGLGLIFWILGAGGILVYYESIQRLGYLAYFIWVTVSIFLGLLFIALGEVMMLLKQNLNQSQALYYLFKNMGGEN